MFIPFFIHFYEQEMHTKLDIIIFAKESTKHTIKKDTQLSDEIPTTQKSVSFISRWNYILR